MSATDDKINRAIAAAAVEPRVTGEIQLEGGRVARLDLPAPLYAQDIIKIEAGLIDVWKQMPKEELPAATPAARRAPRLVLPS